MTAKPQRPAFMPLSPDVDARIELLAKEKGVGTLERPAPERASERSGRETNTLPVEATPRAKMKTLNLELPDYAWTELKIRAAQRQTSLRHVVMMALVADGITIANVDMIEDGRRLR